MNNVNEFIIDSLKTFVEGYRLKAGIKDMEEVLKVCSYNQLLPVMYKVTGEPGLEKGYTKSAGAGLIYESEIKKLFSQLNAAGIRAILLRGLYLGLKLYQDPALRPFMDIDILIEKHNIGKAKKALKEAGYYYSPHLFPEEFFLDSHLHLLYFHPRHRVPVEVHWAIDHPFTTYDIKMDEVFKNTFPVDLYGIRCFDIRPEVRFIFLLIHIQKHLPYLKYLYNGPGLARQIIRDGELLHILDAYLFLKRHGDNLNWPLFIEKSISWNVDGVMYSTLKTVERVFNLRLPAEFRKIEPPPRRPLEKFLLRNTLTLAGPGKRIPKAAGKLVFTPKRLPDLYTWFFPDRKTIIRKYKIPPGRPAFLYYIRNFNGCMSKILYLLIQYIRLKIQQPKTI